MADMLPVATLAAADPDATAEETPMEVDDGLSANAKERATLALPGAPRGPRGKERSKYTEDDMRAALVKMLAQYSIRTRT